MSGETRAIAAFVCDTRFDDLPSEVLAESKKYLLDTIACGFTGARHPWSKIVGKMAAAAGGKPQASIFAQESKSSASQAALVNGVMIGGFESEHVGHVSHPAGTVTPAALAIAEQHGSSGRDFITAVTLGYEVVCRIGEAQTGKVETERGFHNPSANGPFSAAAAVGKLLGFDSETMGSGLGISGSHAGGLVEYAWGGEMTKRLHLGRASQLGLESALLACYGFTGPKTILEGKYGYLQAFSPEPRPAKLTEGLGTDWLMRSLIVKAYPCHVTAQAVVAALQKLKREGAIEPGSVESINIRAGKRLLQDRFLNPAPDSMMGAQYSLLFTTAVAAFRDLDDPLQYDESILDDPNISRLARSITWELETNLPEDAFGGYLDVVAGGETISVDATSFTGSLTDPATMDDVTDKFYRYSGHHLNRNKQDRIVELVASIEDSADIDELGQLIRGA